MSSASLRRRLACTSSAPKPLTTRTPPIVSSTTVASSAFSACTCSTAEWIDVENLRPAMLTSGSGASATRARIGSVMKRIDRCGDDHAEVRHGDRDHHDERLDLLEVARRTAHQLAGLGTVVVADVQRHDVVEQLLAQAGLGPAGLAKGVVATQRRERAHEHAGDGDQHSPRARADRPRRCPGRC